MSTPRPHPSRVDLERHVAGLLDSADSAVEDHIGSCDSCAARVQQMRASDEEFLAQFPSRDALAQTRAPRPVKRRGWLLPWGLPLAAALAAAVALFALRMPTPTQSPADPRVRIKGDSLLELAVKRGGRSARYQGQKLRAGDLLAFRYTTNKRYLLLVSLEQSGKLNVFFADATGRRSMAISPGRRVALGRGVELDAYQGSERLLALFTNAPLEVAVIRRVIAARYRALSRTARPELKIGQLPHGGDQFSWLLRRAGR